MKTIIVSALILTACDGPGLTPPERTLGPYSACEETACDYVTVCQRRKIGIWDFRSRADCLGTFRCGVTPDACLDAVLSLPCLDQAGEDWATTTEENRLGWIDVRGNCQWDSH